MAHAAGPAAAAVAVEGASGRRFVVDRCGWCRLHHCVCCAVSPSPHSPPAPPPPPRSLPDQLPPLSSQTTDGWRGSDADGEGNFLVSPDAPADFVVPAGFQVMDLTREAHRIPGQPA
ncbi:hypothetical protein FJT64_011313 [Amphibalanus amphitrite]|uniref:Uncharacterized protein n=1 Tax=Amphibalanus amphitrite TaxID=1232801 RepID=A0A6A4V2G8_AMPAM|nr:hypothetical protein FJT64_011313 [Amphibalanus amphitrite]